MKVLKIKSSVLILCLLCVLAPAALAVRVDNLYSAEVPLGSGSRAQQNAFDAALAQVLVKVTGRRDIAASSVVASNFGDASRFVQQYRTNPDGQIWVLFDEVALRRELDNLGESVWGIERPTTLVWLVLDEGFGQRRMLASVPEDPVGVEPPLPDAAADPRDELVREQLLGTADARGLPLILPLVDTQEMMTVSLSDVWGGFTESLVGASSRYGSDAILVGRARSAAFDQTSVRWTLLLDDERFDWDGDIASGPNDVADFFAARLATSVGSSSQIVLSVEAVDSLDAYGRLSVYLAELDLVEEISVDRVNDNRVVFSLKVRGDADRLMRSIALQRVLQPIDEPRRSPRSDPFGGANGAQNLHYRLMAGP